MKKVKHSPAPWIVNGSAVKSGWPSNPVTVAEVNLISFVDGKKASHEEQIGNLNMIAASPKMLKLLKESARFLHRSSESRPLEDEINKLLEFYGL